jgi:hypothetical protein
MDIIAHFKAERDLESRTVNRKPHGRLSRCGMPRKAPVITAEQDLVLRFEEPS